MKKFLSLAILVSISFTAISQSKGNYSGDVDKAFGLIKNGAFKNGYKYLITFSEVNASAINVEQNTSYLIFFVYDNSNHPQTNFKAMLMTPDSALQKKYTSKPFDRAQVGVARAAQLQFRTQQLAGNATRPVKLEASPKSTIYVFYKK
jgi:hypothetical protein